MYPILSGIMLAIAFPTPGLFPLAWFCLIPILKATERGSVKVVLRRSFIFAFTAFAISLSWVRITMTEYGGLPSGLSIFFMLLLSAYCSLYLMTAFGISRFFEKILNIPLLAILPFFWVVFEYFRGNFFSGFPWNSMGQSQYSWTTLVQNADWGSFYCISWIIVAVNIAIYDIFRFKDQARAKLRFCGVAGILAMMFLYGHYRLHEQLTGKFWRVGIVQGNIDQHRKWDSEFREKVLREYLNLTNSLYPKHPELVVWPEAALTFYYRYGWRYPSENGSSLGKMLLDHVKKSNVPVLLGTLDRINDQSYNSACLIQPNDVEQYYYKNHLVPFGEYVPLPKLLFFVNRMVEGSIGDFIPSEINDPLIFEKGEIGVTICYENIFPDLVASRVRKGADIICNLTNDAWFGKSSAAEQHFSAAIFRAIECRRPVVRAANTGFSGAINSRGEILRKSRLFRSEAFIADVEMDQRQSFYCKFGNSAAFSCILWTGILVIWVLVFKRTRGGLK